MHFFESQLFHEAVMPDVMAGRSYIQTSACAVVCTAKGATVERFDIHGALCYSAEISKPPYQSTSSANLDRGPAEAAESVTLMY